MERVKAKSLLMSMLAAMLCVAVAVVLAGCGSSGSQSTSSSGASESLEANDAQQEEVDTTGSRYILVIGEDAWEGKPTHADLMCLLRVDLDNHKLYEVTVPRDTKYQFEDGSFDKLNQKLTREGTKAQVKAVADVVGRPIDYYVKLDFDALEKIVDHFGGLDVDLPYSVNYTFYTKDYPDEYFDAGEQTLTGWRAMALSRARTGYGDQGLDSQEMVRQYVDRHMLTMLIQAAYSGGTDAIEPLFTMFQDAIETNIPFDEQVAWAEELGSKGEFEVIGTTGPFYGDIDPDTALWFVTPDEQGWANLMDAVDAGTGIKEATDTFAYGYFFDGTPPVTSTIVTAG